VATSQSIFARDGQVEKLQVTICYKGDGEDDAHQI
jgi:hypothetical protein